MRREAVGKIKGNTVSMVVANPDVSNEGGYVTLNGDGTLFDVDYKTVTFDPNGGTITSGSGSQKIVTATNSLLVLPTVSQNLYTWTGWEDSSGTSYTNGQVMNITSDITLKAQWVAN